LPSETDAFTPLVPACVGCDRGVTFHITAPVLRIFQMPPLLPSQIRLPASSANTPSIIGVGKKVGCTLPTPTPRCRNSSRMLSHIAHTPALLAA